jgi:nucleotide-binding universal stress UspA family protein
MKVLIALDYEPTSQKVAEIGFSTAKAMNAEIILLHVITKPENYFSSEYSAIMGMGGYMDTSQIKTDSPEGLYNASMHFLNKIKLHLNDNTIHTMVREGEVAESILEAAKDRFADIIAIGSHSQKWLENVLLGSITEKVIRHTPIPLLIVPIKSDVDGR